MLDYKVGEIFRLNGKTYQCVTDFDIVTEPAEGMLFRATNGVLYELKTLGSTRKKCGCDTNPPDNLPCRVIDRQAFGKTQRNSLHWYPVEDSEYNETNGLGYKKPWPQTGDLYYYVDTDGSVESCQYADKYDIDNNRRKAGNFFKTKEAAEIAAERVKAAFKDKPVKEGEE